MSKEKLIVILGPTASGKTGLSIELAKKLDTEIISGDSMLVYKGFDIGSAKPTEEEKSGIVHHMIDILEPEEKFNVADFVTEVKKLISEINAKGKIPILAGGTGLYIKSLLEGYEFNETAGDSKYRAYLEKLAEEKGREFVFDMLKKANPEVAERLHINNFRRVIRALEVHHLGGEEISTARKADMNENSVVDSSESLVYDVTVIGLNWERSVLYDRINKRVDIMMEQGLEKEVRHLLESGVSAECQPMKGIGYKEMVKYVNGEISLEQAVDDIKKNTRHLAKRQLTWYRKMPYIKWFYHNVAEDSHLYRWGMNATSTEFT